MEKTDPKIQLNVPKFQEFVEYDEKGNAVILRRSASLAEEAPEVQFQAGTVTTGVQARPTGSLRFFAGFDEVRARLQAKLAVS